MANKPIKDPCEEYGLAITNFVIGEKMNMTKEKLFEHLRQCPKCQDDLRNWKATHAAMKATAMDSSPAGQARKQTDFSKVKEAINAHYAQPMPDAVSVDKIGNAAGDMWHCIGANGPMPITVLPEKCNLDSWTATVTFGWLLGEKKINVDDKKRPNVVSLTPKEQNLYLEETGKIEQE